MVEMNNFRVDQTDISAQAKTLPSTCVEILHGTACIQDSVTLEISFRIHSFSTCTDLLCSGKLDTKGNFG